MRAFFAHPKAWDDEIINAAVAEVAASLRASQSEAVEVISGRDDFQANLASEGNITGWCRSVTRRRDRDGRRWYDLIAVPKTDGIGKATASIVEDALAVRLPVAQVEFLDDGTIDVQRVAGVDHVDAENYIAGWALILADT